MLFPPALLSPEAPASPQWPAATMVSPSRPRGPGRGTLGYGTGGPGCEQRSPAHASHAHLPSQGQTPQEECPAHTLLMHRTCSRAVSGWQLATGNGQQHPGRGHQGWLQPELFLHTLPPIPEESMVGKAGCLRLFLLTPVLQSQKSWEPASCAPCPQNLCEQAFSHVEGAGWGPSELSGELQRG